MTGLRIADWRRSALLLLVALVAGFALIACSDEDTPEAPTEPLKIAFLADFSGPLGEFGPEIQKGVELAIKHVNAAGGVHGLPVEFVVGDDKTDLTAATEEARRLIEVERVAAIVGPLASGITVAVAESIAGPAGVIVISPSATSPMVTTADDADFLFRSTTSDAAQGVVLADLAKAEGLTSVGVLFLDDAYGQGLADAFEGAFGEGVTKAAFQDGAASYLAELQAAKAGGADTLVAIGYPTQAQVFIREALENGLFSKFLFVDGTKSEDLIAVVGAASLEGMKGTAPVGGPDNDATQAWDAAFMAEYGALPTRPFVREAYDAVVAIALAAEKARSNSGAAIRDQLRAVAGPGGDRFIPGAEGVKAAIEAVRAGDDIDFDGAATTLNWDAAGDVTTGFIGVWQYQGGQIVELDTVAFDLSK
ncbi:MAG: ABC transporter substrate-binding protein [Chloroflexi bacterium]|nr:ABC transporter substrate-binding protein [Chloroflexota bacterium]MDA1239602.1 ABC transporter substrate-binding protein [Chloroflexota bacterium]